MGEKLSVKECTSCWGDKMYFGFVGSRQYTEGYETISELEDDNPQFKDGYYVVGDGMCCPVDSFEEGKKLIESLKK